MRSKYLSLVTSLILVSLGLGCTGDGASSEEANEAPLVLLAQEYAVDVEVAGFDCPLGQLQPNGFRAVAQIEQIGNSVVWRQSALSDDGEVDPNTGWVLNGRICDDGDGPVLRLRGGRVARVAEGDRFCRADFRIPAAHAVCPVQEDACADPNTIQLYIDPCTDRLVGGFRSCMVYSESCLGQSACRFAMQWEAVSADSSGAPATGGQDACIPLEVPEVSSGCENECSQCGC